MEIGSRERGEGGTGSPAGYVLARVTVQRRNCAESNDLCLPFRIFIEFLIYFFQSITHSQRALSFIPQNDGTGASIALSNIARLDSRQSIVFGKVALAFFEIANQ